MTDEELKDEIELSDEVDSSSDIADDEDIVEDDYMIEGTRNLEEDADSDRDDIFDDEDSDHEDNEAWESDSGDDNADEDESVDGESDDEYDSEDAMNSETESGEVETNEDDDEDATADNADGDDDDEDDLDDDDAGDESDQNNQSDDDFDMSQFMDENGEIDYAAMMQARMASGQGMAAASGKGEDSDGKKAKKGKGTNPILAVLFAIGRFFKFIGCKIGEGIMGFVDLIKESTGIKSFFGSIHKAIFGNLKMGIRIAIAFLIVIMCTAAMAVVNISKLEKINSNIDVIKDESSNVSSIAVALENEVLSQNLIATMLINQDMKSEISGNITKMSDIKNKMVTTLDEYKCVVEGNEENLALESNIYLNYIGYNKHISTLKELVGQGDYDGAYDEYEEARKISDNMLSDNSQIIDNCSKSLNAAVDDCRSEYESSRKLAIILLISTLVLTVVVACILLLDITSNIKKFIKYAGALNDGDLTYTIKADTFDEFGLLARSLNTATGSFRDLMQTVIEASESLNEVVSTCKNECNDMSSYLDDTASAAQQLTSSMESTTSSTMDMQTASGEIKSAAEVVALKAEDGVHLANGISTKATTLSEQFNKAHDDSINMFDGIKEKLEKSIQDAKKVSEIKNLADTILEITSQTNLIALNAAIEAARAGEAGRGFAVVSEEIRSLAVKSKSAVEGIKQVTDTVIGSVEKLIEQANTLLLFMGDNVLNDYQVMLQATNDYDSDSISVNDMTSELSAISEELAATVDNMVESINAVARMSEEGTHTTELVEDKVVDIANRAKGILEAIDVVDETSDTLLEQIRKFKVEEDEEE